MVISSISPACTLFMSKDQSAVLYDISSGQISLALRQDPHTQTMMSLNICTWLSMIHGTLASIHHHLLPSSHLLPYNFFHLSWLLYIFGSCATRPTITHAYHALCQAHSSYHCGDKLWKV